ncbi:glycine betaine/L-proline ABC transporter substrate-binding protein ProX [Halarcobacter sp.]|uniref:glycine betaine/L-proline ABC transporter substrate-binding protein ProX n=1 Tax=Halarcobacter sp. TaxID=2321133 RepID=UPI0029F574C9|nr:glycine betaine/L-proline ABC transporter substrate-binding protein ProX [Halarcobacter sp.]
MLNKKFIIGALASILVSTSLFATKITAVKTSIAEESFQMKIVVQLLEKMGYEVETTNDVSYDIAYQTIANNAKSDDVYFMAAGWDPLHNGKIEALGKDKFAKFSEYISGCAQGYLIDKKTADKYNIKYINDLKDPKIAKLFDLNNDGKADLTGCNAGWGCEKVIEHQLDAFDLRGTIQHNQGEYSALIADTIANYKTGKPILYYTWTPYWVSGKLIPGKDVVFLQVTHSANPNQSSTKLSNGADYGFAVNSQKIVANASVKKYKDISKLFDIVKLDVNDVSGQNMLMTNGQKKEKDIDRHVKMWIEKNQDKVNSWIKEAKAAK